MSTETSSNNVPETGSVSESSYLDALALGEAAAVVSATVMLLFGVAGAIGIYEGAVGMMKQWHLFFEPTIVGTLSGMIEAAVISFAFVYAFAWLYNAFTR